MEPKNITNFEDFNYVGKEIVEAQLSQPESSGLETKDDANFAKVELDDRYQSVSLPSGFIFYDFDTIRIRKFEIRDLAKMHRVVQNQSQKMFREVIQSCVDRDINLLTPGDFKYTCFWLRLNSYPKTPMTVKWRSKYGNENTAQVLKDKLQSYAPSITKEQYEKYKAEGFTVPTMKFSYIFDEELNDDDDFLYSNAQYFAGNTWEEKLKNLDNYVNTNGLESLNNIKDFDELINHGVQEELTVVDSSFDPLVYRNTLENRLTKLKNKIDTLNEEEEEVVMLQLLYDATEKELNKLNARLEAGEEVLAEPETIFLEVDATEFLSPLLTVKH